MQPANAEAANQTNQYGDVSIDWSTSGRIACFQQSHVCFKPKRPFLQMKNRLQLLRRVESVENVIALPPPPINPPPPKCPLSRNHGNPMGSSFGSSDTFIDFDEYINALLIYVSRKVIHGRQLLVGNSWEEINNGQRPTHAPTPTPIQWITRQSPRPRNKF